MPYNSCVVRGGPPFPDSFPTPGVQPLIREDVQKPIIKAGKGAVRPSSSGKSKGSRRK